MNRKELEEQFTSMLIHTNTFKAYWNLSRAYFTTNVEPVKVTQGFMESKLNELRKGEPKEWISKIFSEGMEITPQLYQVNTLWLKHLEEINWE